MINYCQGTKCKSHLRKKGVAGGAAHTDTNVSTCAGLEGSVHLHCSGASLKLPGHPTQKVSHTETCSLCLTTEKNSNQGQALLSLPRSLRNRQHRQQAPQSWSPFQQTDGELSSP